MSINSLSYWRIFAVLALWFLYPCMYSQTESEIKDFLKHAVKHSIKTPFKASKDIVYNHAVWDTHKFYSNGTKVRIEYRGNQQMRPHRIISEAPLVNKELAWVEKSPGAVRGNTIVSRSYPTDWNWWPLVYAMIDEYRFNSGNYKVSNGRYGTVPCYKITVSYPVSDSVIAHTPPWHFEYQTVIGLFPDVPEIWSRKFTREELNRDWEGLKGSYFATLELLVDKNPKNPFIYSCKAFDAKGNEIREDNWGKVEFVNNPDPKLFYPPDGVKTVNAANKEESGNYYFDLYGAGHLSAADRFGAVIGAWLKNLSEIIGSFLKCFWIFCLEYGWIFAAGLAVCSIIGIVILKRYFRA